MRKENAIWSGVIVICLMFTAIIVQAQNPPTSVLTQQRGTLARIPTACSLGQLYFATDRTAGQNVYGCTTAGNPGVWTLQSGGGSGATGATGATGAKGATGSTGATGASSGAVPAGSAGCVQLYATSNTFGCDASLSLNTATKVLTSPNQQPLAFVAPPSTAPTPALAGAGAGNLTNGVFYYYVTFVSAMGETDPGLPSGDVTVTDYTVDGQVALTSVPLGLAGTTARNVYRVDRTGGFQGSWPGGMVGSIANNTGTVFTDNTANSAMTAGGTGMNTTAGTYFLNGLPFWNASIQTHYIDDCCGAVPTLSLGISNHGNGLAFVDVDQTTNLQNGNIAITLQLQDGGGAAWNYSGASTQTANGIYILGQGAVAPDVSQPATFININYELYGNMLGAPIFGVDIDYAIFSGQTNTPYIFACYNGEDGVGFSGGYSTSGGFCGVNTLTSPTDTMFEVAGTRFPARAVESIRAAPSQSAPLLKFKASDDSDLTTTIIDKDGKLNLGSGVPTSCAGQPANTVAVIATVFTLCP